MSNSNNTFDFSNIVFPEKPVDAGDPWPEANEDSSLRFKNSVTVRQFLKNVADDDDGTYSTIDDFDLTRSKIRGFMKFSMTMDQLNSSMTTINFAGSIVVLVDSEDIELSIDSVLPALSNMSFWLFERLDATSVGLTLVGKNIFEDSTQSVIQLKTSKKASHGINLRELGVLTTAGLAKLPPHIRNAIPRGFVAWQLGNEDEENFTVPITAVGNVEPMEGNGYNPSSNSTIADTIREQVNIQVMAVLGTAPRHIQNPPTSQLAQTERSVGEFLRLRTVEGLFQSEFYKKPEESHSNVTATVRLDVFATRFITYLHRSHVAVSLNKMWTNASAKHFVCAEWGVGHVNLAMFSPSGQISGIADFTLACSIWAECESWLRGPHMAAQITKLLVRLIVLTHDEWQIGGAELANAVEVLCLDLRNDADVGSTENTPAERVRRALVIPKLKVSENITLDRAIRIGARSRTREYSSTSMRSGASGNVNQSMAKSGHVTDSNVSKKRPREVKPREQRVCFDWVAAGEPVVSDANPCPTKRRGTCGFAHVWGDASTIDMDATRAFVKRKRG